MPGENVQTLSSVMSEVMGKVGYVQFDSKAPTAIGGYGYASASAVFERVRAELSERGVAVSGDCSLEHFSISDDGYFTHAVSKHELRFSLGEEVLSVSSLGQGKDKGDKAVMKANTAALKYCVAKALLMSWGDDPEADDGEDVNPALDKWLGACALAARVASSGGEHTDIEEFAAWWGEFGEIVKHECGDESASLVHEAYRTSLDRMKKEDG